ncbi:MAG: hypothetical protein H6839_14880 [Planctomycetes bacterium]|nr:hypothetical protein [Planctomycetota bacterium]
MPKQNTKSKSETAFRLLDEMHEMLNDIAASATILGATPFNGAGPSKALAVKLHEALLEFEIGLAAIGRHSFEVKS